VTPAFRSRQFQIVAGAGHPAIAGVQVQRERVPEVLVGADVEIAGAARVGDAEEVAVTV
jgi:hypothetical protein